MSAEPTTIKVDHDRRRDLIALAGCASDDNYQPLLCGIAFNKARAAATNSYVLGIVALNGDGPDEQRVVPAKELAAALRPAKAKDEVLLHFGDTEATVEVNTSSLFGVAKNTRTLPYTDQAYPDVDGLLAKGEHQGTEGEAPLFNPAKLAKVTAIGSPLLPVQLHWQSTLQPIFVTRGGDTGVQTLIGMVMPVRSEAARR